jgi:hypothetical protein
MIVPSSSGMQQTRGAAALCLPPLLGLARARVGRGSTHGVKDKPAPCPCVRTVLCLFPEDPQDTMAPKEVLCTWTFPPLGDRCWLACSAWAMAAAQRGRSLFELASTMRHFGAGQRFTRDIWHAPATYWEITRSVHASR